MQGRLVVFFFLCWAGAPGPSIGQGSAWMPDADLALADRLVTAWSIERRVFVDRLMTQEVFGQIAHVRTMFCSGDQSLCNRGMNADMIKSAAWRYLDEIAQGKALAVTLFQRMFEAVGIDVTRTGWPAGAAYNRYVSVPLPQGEGRADLYYLHWDGPERIDRRHTTALLATGSHALARSDGVLAVSRIDLDVAHLRDGRSSFDIREIPLAPPIPLSHVGSRRVTPDVGRFCLGRSIDPADPRQASRSGRAGVPTADPSTFLAAETVRIRLVGAPAGCGIDCRRRIAVAFVQAFLQWRVGCTRCPGDTLKLLETEGAMYLEGGLLEYIELKSQAGPGLSTPQERERAWLLLALASIGSLHTSMSFQQISREKAAKEGICEPTRLPDPAPPRSQPHARPLPQIPRSVAERLCGRQEACTQESRCVEVNIDLTGPNCGANVACGTPERRIAINTSRFAFRLGRASLPNDLMLRFGRPKPMPDEEELPIYPIVLHEVGHWFGMPHMDERPDGEPRRDVMVDAASGVDDVCISAGALVMLDNATDRLWPYRLAQEGGIRYVPRR